MPGVKSIYLETLEKYLVPIVSNVLDVFDNWHSTSNLQVEFSCPFRCSRVDVDCMTTIYFSISLDVFGAGNVIL
jgi:hypothetical protein